MQELTTILPMALYVVVGIISLIMAGKSFFSTKFLPFQEQAAGKKWEDVDETLKPVLIFLLRNVGLGFLAVAILMIACPILNYFVESVFSTFAVPAIGLVFCTGLFVNTYWLHKQTNAATPWKGSLMTMVMIVLGVSVSMLR